MRMRPPGFLRCERGVIAVTTALLIVPILAVSLLSLEAVNHLHTKTRLHHSAVASNLLGAKYGPLYAKHQAEVRVGQDYLLRFNARSTENSGENTAISYDPSGSVLRSAVDQPYRYLYTPLLDNALSRGLPEVSTRNAFQSRWKSRKTEYAFVLDESMSLVDEGKLEDIRGVLREFVEDIFGASSTRDDIWISVIGFAKNVNIGRQYADRLVTPRSRRVPPAYQIYGYKDFLASNGIERVRDGACVRRKPIGVSARRYVTDVIGRPPHSPTAGFDLLTHKGEVIEDSVLPFVDPGHPQNDGVERGLIIHKDPKQPDYDKALGTYTNCGYPMVVASTTKNDIIDRIDKYRPAAFGFTGGDEGLAWGYRALSPDWRAVWNSGRKKITGGAPADFTKTSVKKKLIYISDGGGNTGYADGHHGGSNPPPYITPDLCTYIKDQGVEVSVVIYSPVRKSYKDIKMLEDFRHCTSEVDFQPQYFEETNERSVRQILADALGRFEYEVSLAVPPAP